jgi:hypothetical protein
MISGPGPGCASNRASAASPRGWISRHRPRMPMHRRRSRAGPTSTGLSIHLGFSMASREVRELGLGANPRQEPTAVFNGRPDHRLRFERQEFPRSRVSTGTNGAGLPFSDTSHIPARSSGLVRRRWASPQGRRLLASALMRRREGIRCARAPHATDDLGHVRHRAARGRRRPGRGAGPR